MNVRAVLSRRAALLGLTGAAATAGRVSSAWAGEGTCLLTPQAVEGPFYLDPKLVRDDIREDRPGRPLALQLRVIEAGPCTPIARARVDVWHADAQGLYSGYTGQGDSRRISTRDRAFLRGTQFCDADGRVTFRTIYPGWYAGRATHVHFKVFLDTRTLVTGQMYFPEPGNTDAYRDPAYGNRALPRETLNANDGLFRNDDPNGIGLCTLADGPGMQTASLVIGVNREGPPKAWWRRF